jgi:crossover junction endodeoxyribonuclease RusA
LTIDLSLPWPPSVNTYWRHPTRGKLAGRHLISEEGRAYRDRVQAEVLSQARGQRIDGKLAVHIAAHPPDRRRRDLDNVLKALLDALTHTGIWADDSDIDDLRIVRASVQPGGRVFVTVSTLSQACESPYPDGRR